MIKHFNIDFLRRSVIASNDPNDAPEGYLLPSSIACVFEKEGNAWLVFRQKEFTIDCLVHECVHIIHVLMNIVGQKPNEANDEFEAYLCEYVFSNLLWLIFGNEKKIEIKQPLKKGSKKCLKLSKE